MLDLDPCRNRDGEGITVVVFYGLVLCVMIYLIIRDLK